MIRDSRYHLWGTSKWLQRDGAVHCLCTASPTVRSGIGHLILGCNKSSWPTDSPVCTWWMPSLFMISWYIWRKRRLLHWVKHWLFHSSKKRSEGHKLHSCTSIQKCWTRAWNTTDCCWVSTDLCNCCSGLQPQIFTASHAQFDFILDQKPSSSCSLIYFIYSFWLCRKVEHMQYYFKRGSYPATIPCPGLVL